MQILDRIGKHRRAVAFSLLIAMSVMFAYSLARWQQASGVDPALRPLRMVYFSAAIAIQAAEGALRLRRPAVSVGMLAVSIVLLILGSLSPS